MVSSAPPGRGAGDADRAPQGFVSRRGVWLSILSVLILGSLLLIRVCLRRSDTATASSAFRPGIPVSAVAVERGDLNRYLSALGTVTAFNTVTVRTRVDGQIVNIAFKEGQMVHQGELLVEIDPRPYRAALAQTQGQLAKDEATLRNAKITLARDEALYREGVIAAQELDNQRALVGQSAGAVESDRANIASAKVNLAYTRIAAPITGRIGLRMVDKGNIIHATDSTGLAVITQLQPISIVFSIPEDNLPQIIRDMRNGEELPIDAFDRALKNRLATGTLETFDSQIDQATGTIKIKSIFANNDYTLFPNQFVNVRLLVDTIHGALLAPAAAVQRSPLGNFVYSVKPDSTVEMRQVKIAATQSDTVAIDSGVAPGDLLVTDGLDRLQSGARVSVQTKATVQGSVQ